MMPTYSKGRLTGYIVDGIFTPLAPAPTGDDLDNLWDDCCRAIDQRDDIHLDAKLTFNKDTNRHSDWLGEVVTSWIQLGNLRGVSQVNDAVNQYAAHWDRLVRLNAVKDWAMTWATIRELGFFFGMRGVKPLPSKQEVLDRQAEWDKRDAEEHRQREIRREQDNEKTAKFRAELDQKSRVLEFTRARSLRLFPCPDDFMTSDGDITDRGAAWSQNRSTYERSIRYQVKIAVELEMTDGEIEKHIDKLESEGMIGEPDLDDKAYLTPSKYLEPVYDGETRLTVATKAEMLLDLKTNPKWDADFILEVSTDGQYVVTFMAKSEVATVEVEQEAA